MIKDLIYNFISVDTKRGKLRNYLRSQGVIISDRAMRKLVEEMQKDGYNIASSCHRGYFRVRDANDVEDAMREYKSKAKSLFKKANTVHYNFYKQNIQIEFLFKEAV